MTSFNAFLIWAISDGAGLTVHKWFVRETTLALNLAYSYAINPRQSVFKLDIVISMGDVDTTDTAI